MTKYTAADFANAKFAEHPDGRTARRIESERGTVFAWSVERAGGEEDYCGDEYLAAHCWVPVPTKQQLTERDYADYVDDLGLGELTLEEILADFGIEITPDPELTNAERLTEMYKDWSCLANPESETFPEYLDRHGATAPNVKGN